MYSKYHHWFVELGYPQLDINEYSDGEWAIIEYLNSPVIPCQCKWNVILGGLRHIIPSFSFCEKYVQMLDTKKRYYWEMEELKSRQAEMSAEDMDKHREELSNKAFFAVRQNPFLMERIAQNGLQEMDLKNIAKHIPRSAGAL